MKTVILVKYGHESYPGDIRLDGMLAAAEFAAETGGDVGSILQRLRLKKTPIAGGRWRHEFVLMPVGYVQQPTCWTGTVRP